MRSCIASAALVMVGWSAHFASAQSRDTADLLPATTVGYVEFADAGALLELPLTKALITSDLFQEVWRSPNAMKLRGGLTLAELALGERFSTTLVKATSLGAVVAVDPQSKGVVLLARTKDAATSQELYKKLLQIARNDAKSKGDESVVKNITYRDIEAYEIKGAVVAALDQWLVVTNEGKLGKTIVDNFFDSPAQVLASIKSFAEARRELSSAETTKDAGNANESPQAKRAMWAWVDVAGLRSAGAAKELFKRPNDNFAAELILGGLLATVREASTLSASLDIEKQNLKLRFAVPEPTAVKSADYQFFFGAEGEAGAPAPLQMPASMASASAHRDIAELWRRAGDLFGQTTNDQLAQAEATLTTLFSGRDFAEDILGAIEPGVQIVVAAQDYRSKDAPVPKLKLPAFALVTKLRQPSEMQQPLKRIFMSLIGFLNITGAMNEQPQLDIESLKENGATLVTATYAVDVDRPKDWVVPIQYNFSPTLAMIGDDAVLASTQTLARGIIGRLKEASPSSAVAPATADNKTNTVIHLDGPLIADALSANRDQLISQNMLEKGHTQEEASKEIDVLLRILELVQSLDVRFDIGHRAELSADLQLKLDSEP